MSGLRIGDSEKMNYNEFRSRFKTVEEFDVAFSRLSKEEAMAMISATETSTMIKTCMAITWEKAREKYESRQDVGSESAID